MRKAYTQEIKLNHDDVAATINRRTGEVNEVKGPGKVTNPNQKKFDLFPTFTRFNTAAWVLLETQTTDKELAVANKLAMRAKAYTNSLQPLKPEMTISLLAEDLGVDRRYIRKMITKLFKLGVIGKFEVYEVHEVHKKYWLFNPYLSFNGKNISKDLISLFDGTTYAKMMK